MNTEDFTLGNEKEALQAGKVEEVNNDRRRFLKVMSAAVLSGAATIFSGCGGGVKAEGKNAGRVVAASGENAGVSVNDEKEKGHEYWSQFYERYTPSERVPGLVFMNPWSHEVGPGIMGLSDYLHKEMTEEFAEEYLNHFNYRKVSEMKASWDKSLDKNNDGKKDDSEGGREFLPEFFVFSGKVDTVAAEGSPDRGVVSLDRSTAMFARKLTDAPANDQLSAYKDKTIIIVRGRVGIPSNPLGITSSHLVEINTEDLKDFLKWHQKEDYTGLMAMVDK